jgi:hypothetical protein
VRVQHTIPTMDAVVEALLDHPALPELTRRRPDRSD